MKIFKNYPVQFIVSGIVSIILFISGTAIAIDRAIARTNENKQVIEKMQEKSEKAHREQEEKDQEQDRKQDESDRNIYVIKNDIEHIKETVDRIEEKL